MAIVRRALPWILAGAVCALPFPQAAAPASGQPAAEKPHHLRQLDKPYPSGDWVLQCDSWIACRILGVVETRENPREMRPLVIIDRGWKPDDVYQVQFAFIDVHGQALHARDHDHWRAISSANPREQFVFALKPENDTEALSVAHDMADGLISWLRNRPLPALDDGAGRIMRMPRGDLDSLLRRMNELQRPKTDPLTKDQRATWLKPYRFKVLRVKPRTTQDAPHGVKFGCDERPYPRYIDSFQLDTDHVFWIGHCPEGSRMYLQKNGQTPTPFDLSRFGGGIERDVYSLFDPRTSLLTIEISQDQRGDCGQRLRFGWTDAQSFGMIEHRKLTLCRHVPADFWPLVWNPTSWSYADTPPPTSTGDAAPPAGK